MRRLLAFLLLAGLSLTAPAHATTYNVDNTVGNDSNNCLTVGTECATVTHVLGLSLGPGDTICINGNGTYTYATEGITLVPGSSVFLWNPTQKGSSGGGYIKVMACNGGHPIIDVSTADSTTGRPAFAFGLGTGQVGSRYWQIGPGLTFYGGSDLVSKPTCDFGPASSQPWICNTAGALLQGHHFTVTGNTFHDFGSAGFGFSTAGGSGVDATASDYIVVTDNIVYNNANWAYNGGSGFSWFLPVNFDTVAGYHNYILRNRVFNNQVKIFDEGQSYYQDGNGIILDTGAGYTSSTLIADNFVYLNGGSGIETLDFANVDIVGNTLFKNMQSQTAAAIPCGPPCSFISDIQIQSSANNRVYGNLIYGKSATDWYGIATNSTSAVGDNNLLYNTVGTTLGYTGGGHDIIGSDPLFVSNPTNSISANANIQTTSPAKNAFGGAVAIGTVSPDFYGSLRPQPSTANGSIGAAEFCTGACVLPGPPSVTGSAYGGTLLRMAGKVPAIIPPYSGLGNLSTGATWKAYWGIRAYSFADLGNNLIQACTAADAACTDIPSNATTGLLSAAAVSAAGCASDNCTIKTFYDRTGTGNNITQPTIANRATLTTSCTGMTGPYCFASTSSTQYVLSSGPTYSAPFSATCGMSGTGGAAPYQPCLAWTSGGLFWAKGSTPQEFDMHTNSYADFIVSGTSAPVNTWHSVQSTAPSGSGTARISDNNTQATKTLTGNAMGTTYYISNDNGGNVLTGNMTYIAFGTGTLTSGNMTSISALDHTLDGY